MLTHITFLGVAILLVFLNAFFVAAEFGMVKLRPTRIRVIKKTFGLRGRILSYVHKHLDAYLSACQLGITLASLGLGWIGEPAFAHLLAPLFQLAGIKSQELTVFISFFAAFSIISFLHIVIGELVPKSLAIRQSEKVSIWTAIPLFIFYWIMFPAIWVLNYCANSLLKVTKMDETHHSENVYSSDEIKTILSSSHMHDQLSKQELDILRHSIELLDLKAHDVMRPVDEMIALKVDDTIRNALPSIIEHRYSRYPLYHEKTKEFIGIIHVKDILQRVSQEKLDLELKSIMRPVLKVSRHLSAIQLLNKLQEGMPHFALVYSRREHPVGFVTLDNIFQVLVGRVRDEFHKIEESWTSEPDGSFLINGNSTLYVLERALNIEIELDDDTEKTSDTIFDMILTKLERLPHEGEVIEFEKFTLTLKKMRGFKIIEIVASPKKASYTPEAPSEK